MHPLQDSLDFEAAFLRFDLTPIILEAYGVSEIDVADARIIPDSGYVVIRIQCRDGSAKYVPDSR